MERNKIYEDLNILHDTPKLLFAEAFSTEALKYFSPKFKAKTYSNRYSVKDFVIYDKEKKHSYLIRKMDNYADIINENGDDVDFNTIIVLYPELKKFFFEIFNFQNIYSTLKMIELGYETNKYTLEDIDSSIGDFIFNKKNFGKSLIKLSFSFEDFFKLFDLDYYDVRLLTNVFEENWHGNIFIDSDTIYYDLKDGYFYNNFNKENYESLIEILKVIYPKAIGDKNEIIENEFRNVNEVLNELFYSEIDDLVTHYQELIERDSTENFKESVKEDLANLPEKNNIITSIPLKEYLTTVKNLISLYDRLNNQKYDSDINTLLKNVFKQYSVPSYDETRYEYQTMNKESDDDLQKYISEILEKIKEKMYNSDYFNDLDEYKKIIKKISKFGFDKWNILPKDKERKFSIQSVDPKTNEIIIFADILNNGTLVKKSMTLEEFNLFLYQPEFKF